MRLLQIHLFDSVDLLDVVGYGKSNYQNLIKNNMSRLNGDANL